MNDFTNKKSSSFIDADRGEESGARHAPPQKTSKKLIIIIKCKKSTKIEDPLPYFLTTPSTPPQKNLKMTVHL